MTRKPPIGTSRLPRAIGLALACAASACASTPSTDRPTLEELRPRAPSSAAGWSASDEGTIHDTESIFSYIDGHAEVYLAYGMRGCLSRRYAGSGGESDVVLDVFEMGSPDEAFGVFTHDQDGEPAGIGKGSLFRYGWLSFWQGRWFVSVMAEKETPASGEAVLALGRAVSGLLPKEGKEPEIMSALPAAGIEPRSRRYLHDPQILRAHVPLAIEDLFDLRPGTPAALGEYRRDGKKGWLLVVDYPDPAGAARAADRFRDRFGGADRPSEGEDGWFGVRARGHRLVAVVGAGSAALTEALLREAAGSASEERP